MGMESWCRRRWEGRAGIAIKGKWRGGKRERGENRNDIRNKTFRLRPLSPSFCDLQLWPKKEPKTENGQITDGIEKG